jgi:hypothetical protein
MAMTVDIDTTDLEPISRPAPVPLPVDMQPLKNPYFISQVPTTAIINPDAIVNFRLPGVPQRRIVPAQPINMAGAGLNATPTVSTAPVLIQTTPAPTIASPLATVPTGYEFSFFQVRLPLSSTATISSYKVYRSTANNSATASLIRTIVHNQSNTGQPVVVQDSRPNGVTEFFWVSAVNTQGVESSLTPAQSGPVTSNAGFNSSSQIASSFHSNPSNVTFGPTSSTVLSNNAITTAIVIAASTNQFGPGTISYNSGSVNPSSFSGSAFPYYIWLDDPNFSGGAVIYSFSTTTFAQSQSDARIPVGKIATFNTSASSGGGFSGGTTPGGAAGRGIIQA